MRQWFSKELRMLCGNRKKYFSVPSGCKTLTLINSDRKFKSVWKTIHSTEHNSNSWKIWKCVYEFRDQLDRQV